MVEITEEIPFDIPDSWRWMKLKDALILNPRNKLNDDLEVSFIPMPLIDDGFSGAHASDIRTWGKIRTGFTHFAEGDIGVAKITPCFENRKSTIFTNLHNGYGAGTTELHVFRPYAKTILPQYLLAYVKSNFFIDNGKQTFSGAVGQQRISREYVDEVLLPIPPILEQKRIVDTISDIFSVLSNLEKSFI